MAVAKTGYVEADPHVDALLFKGRFEVRVGERFSADRNFLRDPSAKTNCATTHRKALLLSQVPKPMIVRFENCFAARNGQRHRAFELRGVVVEHTQQVLWGRCA